MTRTAQIDIDMVTQYDQYAHPNDYLFQDPDYRREDQERLDAWRRGDWHFVGIRAKAQINLPYGTNPDCWITSEIVSPGLWAVESDAGDNYFRQVFEEEKAILLDMLVSLNTGEIHA